MKRLDLYLNPEYSAIEYPADVETLKTSIPELVAVPYATIERMYRDFSNELYCAGWIRLTGGRINEFRMWLT